MNQSQSQSQKWRGCPKPRLQRIDCCERNRKIIAVVQFETVSRARRNTILSRSRLGLLRFFHPPIRLDSPLPSLARDVQPVCVSLHRMEHSRLVQMQLDVGLVGPGDLVLGVCGVLAVLCQPTRAAQVSVVPRQCHCSSGSRREWISQ
jgi:hypothetical protein